VPWKRPKFLVGLFGGALVTLAVAGGAWWHLGVVCRPPTPRSRPYRSDRVASLRHRGAQVLVDDNQLVKAGQVLVRIDPRDYQMRVDQAKALLASAESQAQGADAGVPLTRETTVSGTSEALAALQAAEAESARAKVDLERAASVDLGAAQANVTAAATHDKAQADLKRMKTLVAKDEISKRQYDPYVAAAEVAASRLQAAQQGLEAARQNIETRRAALAAARPRSSRRTPPSPNPAPTSSS
jgi:membrane fusion protein, multidrug efflux system